MRPAPSVVELRYGVGDERLREQKEEERLCKDDDIVHLVHDAVGHVYALQEDDQDGEDVAYPRQPLLYVASEGRLVVYAVDRAGGIRDRLQILSLLARQ